METPKITTAERNQEIFDAINKANNMYGIKTRLAEQYGISRERVGDIYRRMNKKAGIVVKAKDRNPVLMSGWSTTEDVKNEFEFLCARKGWPLSEGVRQAVKLMLKSSAQTD